MPAYQDRTVSVERTVLSRLARRWVPVILAVGAIALGPFAGGWYYQQQSASRREARTRGETLGRLRGEIADASAALRRQAVALRRIEGGDTSRAAELSAGYPPVVWRAASLHLDALVGDPSFTGIADFYGKLADVEQSTARYLHAVDHARWSASVTVAEGAAVASDASRLREKVETAAAAGESLASSLPASGE